MDEDPPIVIPPLRAEFLVTRQGEGEAAGEGRAGMIYRDLIPGRLGGRYIASHIAIPQGGPVADFVHFHKIGFQTIFCRRGWVRLVYEDQGAPFVMTAGDCVLQPPRIRHRVLEASPGLEVVEFTSPALHETLADHQMELPTGRLARDRDFDGQVFVFHQGAEAPWTADDATGFRQQQTGIGKAAGGVADVRVLRSAGADSLAPCAHGGSLLFGFVLKGSAILECRGAHPVGPCDAFVIPAGEAWRLRDCAPDLALLEVTAP